MSKKLKLIDIYRFLIDQKYITPTDNIYKDLSDESAERKLEVEYSNTFARQVIYELFDYQGRPKEWHLKKEAYFNLLEYDEL